MEYDAQAVYNRMAEDITAQEGMIEGGITASVLQAVSQEVSRLYVMQIAQVQDICSLTTATGAYLDRKGEEYGLTRNEATAAVGAVTLRCAASAQIPAGTTVGTASGLTYMTTRDAQAADTDMDITIPIRCVTPGSAGNVPAGTITRIQPLAGIGQAANHEPCTGGADRETDDAYRARILELIRRPITSGNCNDYIRWAKSITGIREAKCIPCHAGPGTVKVVVLGDAGQPDATLLGRVRAYIETQRPIGAQVTVAAASACELAVDATITLLPGYNLARVRDDITTVISGYCKDNAYTDTGYLSYYRISDLILDVAGVADLTGYTINGGTESLRISDEQYYQLAEVRLNGS